jgi:hypothetical protein
MTVGCPELQSKTMLLISSVSAPLVMFCPLGILGYSRETTA